MASFRSIILHLVWFNTTIVLASMASAAASLAPRDVITINADNIAYVRFQIPRNGQTWKDARITGLTWSSTVNSVTSTCRNFFNVGWTNDQLWRSFDIPTLQYAGIFSAPCLRGMTPQSGLDASNVAVSFILPSGVSKLQTIGPDTNGWSSPDTEAVTGIFGISGVLSEEDYAYTTVGNILEGIAQFKDDRAINMLYLTLEKLSGENVYIQLELLR